MIIGIPKEVKDNEYRVSLTPGGTETLTQAGHQVLVQAGAGEGSGDHQRSAQGSRTNEQLEPDPAVAGQAGEVRS